jgi:hypothetical protein
MPPRVDGNDWPSGPAEEADPSRTCGGWSAHALPVRSWVSPAPPLTVAIGDPDCLLCTCGDGARYARSRWTGRISTRERRLSSQPRALPAPHVKGREC